MRSAVDLYEIPITSPCLHLENICGQWHLSMAARKRRDHIRRALLIYDKFAPCQAPTASTATVCPLGALHMLDVIMLAIGLGLLRAVGRLHHRL